MAHDAEILVPSGPVRFFQQNAGPLKGHEMPSSVRIHGLGGWTATVAATDAAGTRTERTVAFSASSLSWETPPHSLVSAQPEAVREQLVPTLTAARDALHAAFDTPAAILSAAAAATPGYVPQPPRAAPARPRSGDLRRWRREHSAWLRQAVDASDAAQPGTSGQADPQQAATPPGDDPPGAAGVPGDSAVERSGAGGCAADWPWIVALMSGLPLPAPIRLRRLLAPADLSDHLELTLAVEYLHVRPVFAIDGDRLSVDAAPGSAEAHCMAAARALVLAAAQIRELYLVDRRSAILVTAGLAAEAANERAHPLCRLHVTARGWGLDLAAACKAAASGAQAPVRLGGVQLEAG